MFIVKEITAFGYKTNPSYKVLVDLQGTNSWYRKAGNEEAVDEISFNVFYFLKTGQWRVQVPLVWKILNDSLDCVKARMKGMEEIPYGWNPCFGCPNTTCSTKFRAFKFFPKIRIGGASSTNTWILAMNTGAAVAKLLNPKYPARTKQPGGLWVGIQRCSDCIHAQFIKRDNDPDCFDAVQGVATQDASLYHEVQRLPSLPDKRELRDTRTKDPYLYCKASQAYVFDEDACTDYIWRATLTRHCDWVPASPSANGIQGIRGGVGELTVEIPDEIIARFRRPTKTTPSAGGAPF